MARFVVPLSQTEVATAGPRTRSLPHSPSGVKDGSYLRQREGELCEGRQVGMELHSLDPADPEWRQGPIGLESAELALYRRPAAMELLPALRLGGMKEWSLSTLIQTDAACTRLLGSTTSSPYACGRHRRTSTRHAHRILFVQGTKRCVDALLPWPSHRRSFRVKR